MKSPAVFLLAGIVLLSSLTACDKAPSPPNTTASSNGNTNQHIYQVKGVVKAVRPAQKEIEIKHEAIPGYMQAMTMSFDVRDTNELAGVLPGQPVSFRLTVTDTEGWVDEIRPLGVATNTPAPDLGNAPVRVVQPLKVGEVLPEHHLTNELGEPISTTQYKGQAVAITFLFTRCPFPTFCPRLANDFAETQQKLLALPNGPTNWHLLTISIDPEFDKPDVLKAYALAHNYVPAHWTFATGDLHVISAFGDLFGLAFWRDSNGSVTHNMRTAVIDAQGRLQKVFEGKDWGSAEMVAEIVKASKS